RVRISRRTGDAQAGTAAGAAPRAEEAASERAAPRQAGGAERRRPAPGLGAEGAPDQSVTGSGFCVPPDRAARSAVANSANSLSPPNPGVPGFGNHESVQVGNIRLELGRGLG